MILDTMTYEVNEDYRVKTVSEWSEIEDVVRLLDGNLNTDLMVKSSNPEDRRQIIVMGGGAHYVVTASIGGKKFMQKSVDQPADEYLELILGGLSTEISRSLVVSLPEAIQAVRAFCFKGELDPMLVWHEQPAYRTP